MNKIFIFVRIRPQGGLIFSVNCFILGFRNTTDEFWNARRGSHDGLRSSQVG